MAVSTPEGASGFTGNPPHAPNSPTPTPPNRAKAPERVQGDHETPLIQLHGGMRPTSTSIQIQRKNAGGGFGELEPHGNYETGTADKVHELLHGVKNLVEPGTRVHAEVAYHPDDIAEARAKASEDITDKGGFGHIDSGLSRTLAIHAEAKRRTPTKAGTSFTA